MNRKGNHTQDPQDAGAEISGPQAPLRGDEHTGADTRNYLEYENIPDPISFDEPRPSRSNANEADTGKPGHPQGRQ